MQRVEARRLIYSNELDQKGDQIMIRLFSVGLLIALLGACSSSPVYHKFMRGQIVGVDDDQVVFCIGTETGASVGEELVAYRYTYNDYYDDTGHYVVSEVGQVVVRELVNEHFAKGIVTSGEVTKHDVLRSK